MHESLVLSLQDSRAKYLLSGLGGFTQHQSQQTGLNRSLPYTLLYSAVCFCNYLMKHQQWI